MADTTRSRRRFLAWVVTTGGLSAAGFAAQGLERRGPQAPPPEPTVMPPLYPGPRIGEPGYSERVAALFRRADLPAQPSSY
jgi:hypothetical protein